MLMLQARCECTQFKNEHKKISVTFDLHWAHKVCMCARARTVPKCNRYSFRRYSQYYNIMLQLLCLFVCDKVHKYNLFALRYLLIPLCGANNISCLFHSRNCFDDRKCKNCISQQPVRRIIETWIFLTNLLHSSAQSINYENNLKHGFLK